jgi:2-phosphosulfolactate phosphatase
MKFVITDDQNLDKTKDELVVVIDVLRAFTTACYAMSNNPRDYIIVGDVDLAFDLKNNNPNYILMGEREGFSIPGFDYGNSPTEIKGLDFSGKTVVQTTTLGTRGIINAFKHTANIVTGSFANAGALINYIKKENPDIVYLFCTDGRKNDNEDLMLAKYIQGYFENKPLNINIIKNNLIKHSSGIGYLTEPRSKYSKSDFFLAFELDKFDFILKANLREGNLVHLNRIDI